MASVGVLCSHRRKSVPVIALAIALLTTPARMLAQHGGGGRSQPGANSKPVICVHDCIDPHSGLGDDDDRNLERLMAVQATPDQTTSFNTLLKDVQAARDRLQSFIKLEQAPAASAPSDPPATLDRAVEKIRISSRNFLASFSPVQKSGLKEAARKVETADSDLDKQRIAFDHTLQSTKADSPPVAASAANLDTALATFQKQQLALGREMSIVLPSDGQDLSFILPSVKTAIDIAGRSISIALSGATAAHPRQTVTTSSVCGSSPIFPTCSRTSPEFSAPCSRFPRAAASALRFSTPRSLLWIPPASWWFACTSNAGFAPAEAPWNWPPARARLRSSSRPRLNRLRLNKIK
jgi:hypothetical protein